MQWLNVIGLVLNCAGTFLVAISFGKNPGGGHQKDAKGRKIYLASFLYPTLFYAGLGLLGTGFALQLWQALQASPSN
jgi:hypothetical protein